MIRRTGIVLALLLMRHSLSAADRPNVSKELAETLREHNR